MNNNDANIFGGRYEQVRSSSCIHKLNLASSQCHPYHVLRKPLVKSDSSSFSRVAGFFHHLRVQKAAIRVRVKRTLQSGTALSLTHTSSSHIAVATTVMVLSFSIGASFLVLSSRTLFSLWVLRYKLPDFCN